MDDLPDPLQLSTATPDRGRPAAYRVDASNKDSALFKELHRALEYAVHHHGVVVELFE